MNALDCTGDKCICNSVLESVAASRSLEASVVK